MQRVVIACWLRLARRTTADRMVAHRKPDQRRDNLCACGPVEDVLAASHGETFKVNATAVQRGAPIRLRHLQRRKQYHAQVRQRCCPPQPTEQMKRLSMLKAATEDRYPSCILLARPVAASTRHWILSAGSVSVTETPANLPKWCDRALTICAVSPVLPCTVIADANRRLQRWSAT